ncbi:hypothetical protein HFN98_05745 [Rhizobium laguerreae]|uniref:hypothetical protein n=1 Tax=Rhizobium laguerreae TaxID=1076926 RepID=UPI001C907960|nr:hypothetical protein [Rhizobium laguerreae]MBY3330150.1 hypothetical protein [Rhizobium laguerreae]
MMKLDNQAIRAKFSTSLRKKKNYAAVNLDKLNSFEWAVSQTQEERLATSVEVVNITEVKSKTCVLSYRWGTNDGFLNLHKACLRASTWGFTYALCDVVSIKSRDNVPDSVVRFNQFYRDYPVVHYYPNVLTDSRRVWIAGELHKSFTQSEEDILATMISDKSDNESMYTYAVKTKLLLTFFDQHEHNNLLPDHEFGSSNCTCFREIIKYKYEYIDNSTTSCSAERHFTDQFLSNLTYNVDNLRAGRPISSKTSTTKKDRIIRLIEGLLNSDGDDFAGTVPLDVLYLLHELVPDVIKLNRDELRTLREVKHTCLASKITASFVLLAVHGLLTSERTNALSFCPIYSDWMTFIANLILGGCEELDPPPHNPELAIQWHSRRMPNTFTGCKFVCHVVEVADNVMLPAPYILKVVPEAVFLHTALNALNDNIFCNCDFGDGETRKRAFRLDQFESAIAIHRARQDKTFEIQDTDVSSDDPSLD